MARKKVLIALCNRKQSERDPGFQYFHKSFLQKIENLEVIAILRQEEGKYDEIHRIGQDSHSNIDALTYLKSIVDFFISLE